MNSFDSNSDSGNGLIGVKAMRIQLIGNGEEHVLQELEHKHAESLFIPRINDLIISFLHQIL